MYHFNTLKFILKKKNVFAIHLSGHNILTVVNLHHYLIVHV